MNNSKDIGQNGETITLNYLLNKNYFLLEKNYHSRYGEIDIIVENEKYIVFVEVKTRNDKSISRGVESVDRKKREKIIKTAFEYILKNEKDKQPRFDVSEILVDFQNRFKSINYFENAFDLEEYSEIF